MATSLSERRASPALPGLLLGVGFGGFVDGIVLHQILQWHHMLSATDDNPPDTLAGLETNVLADGLFHLVTWIFVFVGLNLAIRAWQRGDLAPPWRRQAGLLLTGWALFNLVEGIVDHHLLQVHHVREDVSDTGVYDVGFLLVSVVLLVVGVLLARHRPAER